MIKLHAHPGAVSALLGYLDGSPEQIAFLQGVIQTHGANPQDYYVTNPPLDRTFEQLQQLPAFQAQDWSRFAHPHVIAQLLVDLCEKAGQPLPDNLHVAVDGKWEPLAFVQPTYTARPVQVQAPAPAPVAKSDPYPDPQPVVSTPPAPATLQLQPDPEVLDAEFVPAQTSETVERPVMGATVTMHPAAAAQIDAARAAREAATVQEQTYPSANTPATAPAQAVAMPVQDAPAPSPAPTLAGAGQFGLPQPFMTASKGTSVFDKNPEGTPPTTASPRQVRDLMAMMPHMFAAQAGDVVGKGKGSVQRHRLYTAALLMLHTALSSVPDKNCPVGYLLWHLEHLRYNASQTPGGQTMLAYETWLYNDGGDA